MAEALRPLSVAELLDRTFLLYRRHFVLFVGIAGVPAILLLVIRLLQAGSAAGGTLVFFLWSLVTLAAYLITTALSQGATIVAVSQVQLGRPAGIADSFAAIRPRIGEIIVVMLNVGVRVMLGMLLFIVPGVILALMYALAVPVAVLEERGIADSLTRSADLTRGHRGRIFLIYFLLVVLIIIVGLLWQIPLAVLFALSSSPGVVSPAYTMATLITSFFSQALLGPFMTIGLSLMYYDMRVRKDAFDLEHMMQQLDEGAAGSPA